ncbi:MAG: hypothetical protein Q8L27_02280 [archaeon]|nr:hypothetical protein [archaeon]
MKKYLGYVILAGILSLFPQNRVYAQENKTIITEKEPLSKETPTEVVTEIIDKGKVEKRDFLNFIARIDEEKIDDRTKYAKMDYVGGFCEALKDKINDDPFFYMWEDYRDDEIPVENQMLNALWEISVAKFPEFFGRLEKTGVYIKRNTTFKTRIRSYRFKVNPELDNRDFLRIKTKIKATNSVLDNLIFKISKDEIKIEKTWSLEEITKRATLSVDTSYDWEKSEYCGRISLKFPWWFETKKEE